MASNVITSAGTTISISAGLPATNDATGYAALTFTEIAEVTDLGEFGREYTLVTHNPLGNRATVKRKGSFNDGSIQLQLGRDATDAGQALIQTASNSDANHSFKVEAQDGEIFYFQAQVMSYKTNVGSVDQILGASTMLEIDSEQGIVTVAAP